MVVARCTAPMSHAGQGTATENAAEIVYVVRVENEAFEICFVCWAPDHLVSLDKRIFDTRPVLRACDIGSGGLDHMLASGQDVNTHVLDTDGCRRHLAL